MPGVEMRAAIGRIANRNMDVANLRGDLRPIPDIAEKLKPREIVIGYSPSFTEVQIVFPDGEPAVSDVAVVLPQMRKKKSGFGTDVYVDRIHNAAVVIAGGGNIVAFRSNEDPQQTIIPMIDAIADVQQRPPSGYTIQMSKVAREDEVSAVPVTSDDPENVFLRAWEEELSTIGLELEAVGFRWYVHEESEKGDRFRIVSTDQGDGNGHVVFVTSHVAAPETPTEIAQRVAQDAAFMESLDRDGGLSSLPFYRRTR